MRQPPSPLLLSARKRRPRRNPPRGAQLGTPSATPPGEARQQQGEAPAPDEKCALLERDPAAGNARTAVARDDDDERSPSSR